MNWSPLLLAASIAFAPPRAAAQNAPREDLGEGNIRHHREFLVSTDWLAQRLQSPGVVVVQVGRTDAAYLAGHIPGARFLPLTAVATTAGGVPNEFPPEAELVAAFRDLGVGDSARIVLYGDDAGLLAARAWVALDLLGQSGRAALLDGGLARWKAEQRPVETGSGTASRPASAATSPFAAHWRTEGIVTASWVRSRLGDASVALVDARSPETFAGPDGHLPGARSIFWMSTLDSARGGTLKTMHTLHEGIWKPAGADAPAVGTVVTYCQTGMQASFDYFVARYIGYPDVRMYDGSMAEWVRLAMPVERSSQ